MAVGGGSGRRHALAEGQALGRPLLALDRTGGGTRLALRSEWETGRHFEPAHLLAIRSGQPAVALFPVTHMYVQLLPEGYRAPFTAAGLLSPCRHGRHDGGQALRGQAGVNREASRR